LTHCPKPVNGRGVVLKISSLETISFFLFFFHCSVDKESRHNYRKSIGWNCLSSAKICAVNFFWKATHQNNSDIPACPADILARKQVDPVSQICKDKADNHDMVKEPGNR
jgi:hypothetical protein